MKFFALIFLFSAICLASCAALRPTAPQAKTEEKPPEEPKKTLTPKEQGEKAFNLFTEILAFTETGDREAALPKIEATYLKITAEYPDTPLAQESYWRLISIYVNDYTPPQYEKAELLYYEFLRKYPGSGMKTPVEDTLSQSYHKNAKWENLLAIHAQAVDEYNEKGRISSPEPLFMSAEAKLHKGNIEDAEKYYKAVINLFPNSFRATISKKRLEGITDKKAKQP
ncbi:MAG: tetratricopeptide repeat protein [Nitrospirae bacterium]|nr:tetratricopeptide repeat protein [Nitrospirota bacterium]